LIPGIMEHLERAGIHSGDSISIYPSKALTPALKKELLKLTQKLSKTFDVKGLMNIQLVEKDGIFYCIEINLRASRTVPFLSKITGVPMIALATGVMLGKSLKEMAYGLGLYPEQPLYAVKIPVFSNDKLVGVDVELGPNMKSTGEMMCIESTVDKALAKGFMAIGNSFNHHGKVVCIIDALDSKTEEALEIMNQFKTIGYELVTDEETASLVAQSGAEVEFDTVMKSVYTVFDDSKVDFVVTNLSGGEAKKSFGVRRFATEKKIPCVTAYDTYLTFVDILSKPEVFSSLEVFDINSF